MKSDRLLVRDKKLLKSSAKKVIEAVDKDHGQDPFSVMTRYGEVQIQSVSHVQDQDVDLVEVYLAGQTESDESHYRVINPPLMVKGQDGELVEDPVLALAEVISRFGGKRK